MKLVKTAGGKKTIKMSKKEWQDIGKKAGWMDFSENEEVYKGHKINIWIDVEPNEVSKAFHDVTLPSGEKITADISPYDKDIETVKLWIDAGYPGRVQYGNVSGNWDKKTLQEYLENPEVFEGKIFPKK